MSSIIDEPRHQKRAVHVQASHSTEEQASAERECEPFFVHLPSLPASQLEHLRETGLLTGDSFDICLLRDKHVAYLEQTWMGPALKSYFVSLDASRTWMLYWTLQAADLLGHGPDKTRARQIIETIEYSWTTSEIELDRARIRGSTALESLVVKESHGRCTLAAGGFGGGPGQMPHAATTYAAVLALAIVASIDESALAVLDRRRPALYAWLLWLQQTDGSFRMHHDGEMDVRASYCVLAVTKLLGLLESDTLFDRPAALAHLAACQTFEGGFGGEPFAEAHGGYTFCATAAVYLLGGMAEIDLPGLTGWLARRQMSMEGGFNGRSNKLVDGCYSFWQGGALAIVSQFENGTPRGDPWLQGTANADLLFDQAMLERYILLCAQEVKGGLRDKPSKARDFYHSCYTLSGLSVAQHSAGPHFGHPEHSSVAQTHPVYNIRVERVQAMLDHFCRDS